MGNTDRLNLFIILMCLVFLDVFTTQFITAGIGGIELNPVMRSSMQLFGTLWYLPKLFISYLLGKFVDGMLLKFFIFAMICICIFNIYGIGLLFLI